MPNTTNKARTSALRQFRQVLEEKSVELRAHMGGPKVNPALQIAADPYDTSGFA